VRESFKTDSTPPAKQKDTQNTTLHTEIKARWTKKINDRLNIDRITATKIKRDINYTRLTDATWRKALQKQGIPHENWTQHQEVFSG
jgi:hypothetical protein